MNHKWNAEKVFKYWVSKNILDQRGETGLKHYPIVPFYEKGEHIPIAELEGAVIKAAKIVSDLGTGYIDIFERAEKELKQAKLRMETIERIYRIAIEKKPSPLEDNLIKP